MTETETDHRSRPACDKLRDTAVVGRIVLYGRWTVQIVEDFDDNYWSVFRQHERRVRGELQGGVRHLFEAEMKERRRTRGDACHERRP